MDGQIIQRDIQSSKGYRLLFSQELLIVLKRRERCAAHSRPREAAKACFCTLRTHKAAFEGTDSGFTCDQHKLWPNTGPTMKKAARTWKDPRG